MKKTLKAVEFFKHPHFQLEQAHCIGRVSSVVQSMLLEKVDIISGRERFQAKCLNIPAPIFL